MSIIIKRIEYKIVYPEISIVIKYNKTKKRMYLQKRL
jgi:hypothetical protein